MHQNDHRIAKGPHKRENDHINAIEMERNLPRRDARVDQQLLENDHTDARK